jgi:hypothetical protein
MGIRIIRAHKINTAIEDPYYFSPITKYLDGEKVENYTFTDETSYVGMVLEKNIKEVKVMSDVWDNGVFATVWNPSNVGGKLYPENKLDWRTQEKPAQEFMVGTHFNESARYIVTVDAPKETIDAWKAEVEREKRQAEQFLQENRELERRSHIVKGSIVTVVKGRKVEKGTTGKVLWLGDNGYGTQAMIATSNRKGRKTGKNGKVFENSYLDIVYCAVSNLSVVGKESNLAFTVAQWAFENNKSPVDCAENAQSSEFYPPTQHSYVLGIFNNDGLTEEQKLGELSPVFAKLF